MGGAEKVCLGVIKALHKDGYKITLATIERTDWYSLEERFGPQVKPYKEKYLVGRMPIGKLAQVLLTPLFFIPMLLFLRMQVKKHPIVNTYGDLSESIADISYVNAIPVRIAHRVNQSGLPDSFVWRLAGQIYDFALKPLNRFFAGSDVLTNSTFMQTILKEFLGQDSTVVYPPVDLDRFARSPANSGRKDLVVTVSRIKPGKNLTLIPRIAKLVDRGDFVVVGAADEASKHTISRLVELTRALRVDDRVTFIINQPAWKLDAILKSAKVFLHSQTMEGFGMAIVEAMGSGCVPVVPRTGGPWSDILDQSQGKYGYSYQTITEAASLVSMLLENEKLRIEVSDRARLRAIDFDSAIFERKILKILERTYLSKFRSHTPKTTTPACAC